MKRRRLAGALILTNSLLVSPAWSDGVLRIGMTASDVPTTTGMPNNGFEGMRFLGYPAFEGLVLWDLSRPDRLATLRPGLAERWEQAPGNKKAWIFHLRRGVKFHDGSDFNADAVIWNLDRYFKSDSPQFEPAASGMTRARVPVMAGYRKIDDFTVEMSTKEPASYFPFRCIGGTQYDNKRRRETQVIRITPCFPSCCHDMTSTLGNRGRQPVSVT